MNNILSFELFEAKLVNITKIKGNNSYISSLLNNSFEDSELIPFVYIKKNNKLIHIKWNDKINHVIKDKIKSRTQLVSIKEFNDILTNMIIELFSERFEELEKDKEYYDLYSKEHNLHILTKIKYDDLFKVRTFINVITVLPQNAENYYKIIKFN
ncbi:hypothetical protein M0Q50_01330 [bacterium]|jgi:hypothetical protein|nr:hypothetical protein [bacterium]